MYVYYIALLLSVALALMFTRRYALIVNGQRIRWRPHLMNDCQKAFLALLPLTLVLAFRWNVGVDSVYGNSYSTAYHMAARGLNSRNFEWGYYWLSSLFARNRVPFFWFLFVLALQYMICMGYGIGKLSVSPAISIVVLLLLMSYFDSFSALRQAIAQGICIVGLAKWMTTDEEDDERKRTRRYIATILLASMFHLISLMYLVLFFVCRIRFKRKTVIWITLGGVVASPVLRAALPKIFDRLLALIGAHYTPAGFASSYALLSFLIMALCIWKHDDILKINERASFLIMHSVCTFILMMNSSVLVLPFRFFDALKICYIFTIPYILKSIRGKQIRALVTVFLFGTMLVFFINAFYFQDNPFANYQSAFENWDYVSTLY